MAIKNGKARLRGKRPFSSDVLRRRYESSKTRAERKERPSSLGVAGDVDELHNLYEYTDKRRTRRVDVKQSFSKEEVEEKLDRRAAGSDDESEPENIVHIGALDMDGVVNADDDEEIESDEGSGGDNDEGLTTFHKHSDDESDVDDDYDLDSEGYSEEEGDLDALDGFIDSLPSKKRKADSEGDEPHPQKRRIISERTEIAPEGEFAGPTSSTKLRAQDLIASLEVPGTNITAVKSLKSSTKALTSASRDTDPLPTPLAPRLQDRVDRKAAYEQTKDEVKKWNPATKLIEEAELLSFPLQAPEVAKPTTSELVGTFKPSNELESAIDRLLKSAGVKDEEEAQRKEGLEAKELSIQEIRAQQRELSRARDLLHRAQAKATRLANIKSKTFRKLKRKEKEKATLQLHDLAELDSDLAQTERMKLEMERARERATLRHKNGSKWMKNAKGSLQGNSDKRRGMEDMLQRSTELRQKIAGTTNTDTEGDDSDQDDDVITRQALEQLDNLDREDMELEAQQQKGVYGMKFMREALARQMKKTNEDMDDFRKELGALDEDDSDSDEEDGPRDFMRLNVSGNKGRFVYQPDSAQRTSARRTRGRGPRPPSSDPPTSDKRVASPVSSTTLKSSDHDPAAPSSVIEPSQAAERSGENPWLSSANDLSSGKISRRHNEVVLSKNSNTSVKAVATLKKHQKKTGGARQQEADDAAVDISLDATMVLANDERLTGPSHSSKKQTSGGVDKAANDHRITTQVSGYPLNSIHEEDVSIHSKRQDFPNKSGKPIRGKGDVHIDVVDRAFEVTDDDHSDQEISESGVPTTALRQRHLVAQAFAGDNVVEEFEEEKRREIEKTAPREEDVSVPGWGTWAGAGVKRKRKIDPRFIKKIEGVEPVLRKDFGKKHVIISEKKDAKAAMYQIKDIPFPYTSRAQYERSLEVPLGREWNTITAHERATLPRVVTKMGAVIEPLEALF